MQTCKQLRAHAHRRTPTFTRTCTHARFDKVSLIKDDHVTIARRELHQMAHPEECADQACAVEHRSPEGRGVAGLVSQRPGNAPRGTLHVVELHEQLKNVIEK